MLCLKHAQLVFFWLPSSHHLSSFPEELRLFSPLLSSTTGRDRNRRFIPTVFLFLSHSDETTPSRSDYSRWGNHIAAGHSKKRVNKRAGEGQTRILLDKCKYAVIYFSFSFQLVTQASLITACLCLAWISQTVPISIWWFDSFWLMHLQSGHRWCSGCFELCCLPWLWKVSYQNSD